MASYNENSSLESLIDELGEDLNEDITSSIAKSAQTAISTSPVDTGRFISSWRIGIDNFTVDSNETPRDLVGDYSYLTIVDQLNDFDILSNESVTLYNNVLDSTKDQYYAQTVSYDFTGGVAYDIISNTEQQLYGLLG